MTSQKWESREEKKLLKPLMEKRRRERMNCSLARLRVLLLEATQDERLKNPKVEKAEILQKTVQFLKSQPLPEATSKEDALLQRYHHGYRECLTQATHFLQASSEVCSVQKAFCVENRCRCVDKIPASPRGELPWSPLASSNSSYEPQQGYSPDAFVGCSPPLGGATYVLPPPLAPFPAGQGLLACVPSPAQPDSCNNAPQSRLLERRDSAGLRVWRPWP